VGQLLVGGAIRLGASSSQPDLLRWWSHMKWRIGARIMVLPSGGWRQSYGGDVVAARGRARARAAAEADRPGSAAADSAADRAEPLRPVLGIARNLIQHC
jgi:hypothetical protein